MKAVHPVSHSVVVILIIFSVFGTAHAAHTRHDTDLLIVGGTESGWAAAIQAARMGVRSITIVHDGRWLGGQYTEQALACVDENKGVGNVGWGVDWHPMKRAFHRSGLFKELMDRIETFNEQKYGSPMPGRPFHGPSTFRPAEAEAIFREMLHPYVDSGQVRLFWQYYPVAASTRLVTGQRGDDQTKPRQSLTGLTFRSLVGDSDLHVRARLTIDASDWGEAIQVAGAAFECGPDPRSRYGESEAPTDLSGYPPNEMNPITWAMIVVQSDNETPIPRPRNYDDRNYVRTSRDSLAAMPDLPWDRPVRLGSIPAWPAAGLENASPRQLSVFNVRRVVDGYTSKERRTLILLNYMLGQDYPLERLPQRVIDVLEADEVGASRKNIVTMSRRQRQIIFDDAKQHALGVLYHLQTFVHDRVADKTHSFRRFHLSSEFGTPDGLPPKPYIRESLRLKAMYMMREQDGRNTNGPTKQFAKEQFARVMYHDGIAAWQFHYDFHRTGRAYLRNEGQNGPWVDFEKPGRNTHILSDKSVFPLRSLIPREMDGLVGAQKNVGYSSIVSAAIRLHDQCVYLGQAAGAVAAVSLADNIAPRRIPFDRPLLERVRDGLCGTSTEGPPMLLWPFRDLPVEQEAFVAINRLASRDAFPIGRREVDFRPNAAATDQWRTEVVKRSLATKQVTSAPQPPTGAMTRGEFARHWWQSIATLRDKPFPRQDPIDADGDGILDEDDALPLQAGATQWPVEIVPPAEDGHPEPLPNPRSTEVRQFNFGGSPMKSATATAPDPGVVTEFRIDSGLPFDAQRGFGWSRDISENRRRRGLLEGDHRDTFLFTRTHDVWELDVPPECLPPECRLSVTVCIGDSGHAQVGQNVTVEGDALLRGHDTELGSFAERTVEVGILDGRLTLEIGKPGGTTNTCLNWVRLRLLADE
ncbi:MAG TPA: FAD-dependent oxidoreductase [Pirellulaceae bacterium]|nr:FAD-dependent oxidoreductase [Pirellulaceae bacterium]